MPMKYLIEFTGTSETGKKMVNSIRLRQYPKFLPTFTISGQEDKQGLYSPYVVQLPSSNKKIYKEIFSVYQKYRPKLNTSQTYNHTEMNMFLP